MEQQLLIISAVAAAWANIFTIHLFFVKKQNIEESTTAGRLLAI